MHIFLVDADDTLWDTQSLYTRQRLQFLNILKNASVSTRGALELLDRVEIERIQLYGTSLKTTEESQIIVYGMLSHCSGLAYSASVEDQIRQSIRVLNEIPEPYPDAKEFLLGLEKLGLVYIYTLSSKERILDISVVNNLPIWRNRVITTPRKDEEAIASILRNLGNSAQTVWCIGNSLRQDIQPALKMGLNVVHVVRKGWRYDIPDEPLPRSVPSVSSLRLALHYIRRSLCSPSVPVSGRSENRRSEVLG